MNHSTDFKEDSAVSVDVVIIGSGFSGLGMATALRRKQGVNFVVLERAHDVGGTWRDNTYPGAACDIQSHLYSYSFRPNPQWTRVYARQPEILEYLRATAEEENLLPHIRFGEEVLRADWIEARKLWKVETNTTVYYTSVLISAAGHLSDPSFPDIEGLESFEGELFHSARWDHSYDYAGKRVGVIGTGASAIQIVPELAKTVQQLTVFQRSAPYIIPRQDYEYTKAERGMFARFPDSAQALRDELFWGNESRFPQRRRVPAFIDQITRTARQHLDAQIVNPELKQKLTPDYAIGCKRILISNDYYPTLTQEHVSLETAGIARVESSGVVLRDGRSVDLDLLVVATGFEAADLPIAQRISGKNQLPLADAWHDGGQAFACTTVAGFPNLFVMLGPNTGLGAGSIIYMVETQVRYIEEAVEFALNNRAMLEPHAETQERYVQSIYTRANGSVWVEGGCSSWYLHPTSGKLTTLWPDFMSQFRRENGTFSTDGYDVSLLDEERHVVSQSGSPSSTERPA
ncbi:flavin-containing monooxygenase [Burkholderia stabilis]|uniref:4-hydroxyacetophenone monooxygenase,3-(3-hydroxyphenyl)propionate hydroxylase,Lysine/ornithine N-monooxygenase,flavin-dependent oxidoreductase, MSMEG_0569 family,Flavin-binding monooxygenase-like n=1 Tax=Burkholderia stabilis TaxID=95485 RepID=A0AAJ5N7V6_9BURK|nr:NAD(P)/FAD-dependent oxidoreductase [Burkholderia stabilis]VBB13436.1 4-hydroxyacetophenone monooxygenase,3-(3-hydroxyphenyl)propionate hydroxylase,Lysine/ornithine N-monooxygenase,flavin-dependent oxidoreductase, MSMEG_0569 family,Flavin-binding monooxygenase-like [Burkholderia stabilis]